MNGPIDGYIVELRHEISGSLVNKSLDLGNDVTSYTFNKLPVDTE